MTVVTVLEDEHQLREELVMFLNMRGYTVRDCGLLSEFWPLMDNAEIAILDITLPDGSGLDALIRMREQYPHAGIIILTARSTIQEKLDGLYAGADHYLVKPFRLLELEAIIESLLRRIGGGWRLDQQRRRLITPNGHSVSLSKQELILFKLLSEHPGQTISRRTFVEALGYNWLAYDSRRIDTFISRLRRRWREKCQEELPLKTAYSEGYAFTFIIKQL